MNGHSRTADDRLADILDASRDCIAWTARISANEIAANTMLFAALCRLLGIIGEAANHLPPEYRTQMPLVPWRKVVATRNLLIHRYWVVDRGLLLLIIYNDLPKLVTTIQDWRTREGAA
jgi:uncharacterized protein with HEPN domain